MKGTNKKILIIALILTIVTTYLAYTYLKRTEGTMGSDTEYRDILVAAVDIPARTKITAEMLKEIKIPINSYMLNSIQDINQIVGVYTKEPILEGEVIPSKRLVKEDKKDLALRIPEGKRAIAISVNPISGVADLIKPGDNVDVFSTFEGGIDKNIYGTIQYSKITKLMFQNAEVLAIDKQMNRPEGQRQETPGSYGVTLAVDPMEAEKFILMENMGEIKLALRPEGDNSILNTLGAVREELIPDKGKKILSR